MTMNKEKITFREAVCILAIFICGSSAVMGGLTEVEQDSWISLILSQLFVFPIVTIYARIMKLYPELNLFEILNIIFGKVFGKIITLLFTWYAIHLAAIVLRSFSEFFQISSLHLTPLIVLTILIFLVSVYLAKSGVKVFGRWSILVFIIFLTIILMTSLLLLKDMDIGNIMPFMNHSTVSIISGSYKLFTFPFAETVLFLALADSIKKEDSPYKIYFLGVALGALFLLLIMLRNILTLGPYLLKSDYFPSYNVVRIIEIGDFFLRIEESIADNFILGGITKIAVCLFAASKGLASLFNIKDYHKVIIPVGLSSAALSCILYTDIVEVFNFISIYQIYVIPFQIILPVLIWLGAEIKKRIGLQSSKDNK